VVEARLNAAGENAQTIREVGEEEIRLVALDLPVLRGSPVEVGVQLHGLVNSSASLVL